MLVHLVLGLLLAADGNPAPAQATGPAPETVPNDTMPPFPASPAFQAIGVGPTGIMHPSTGREFVGDVAGIVDSATGHIKGGFALEVTPIWTWATAENTTLRQWREDSAARYASWFAVSLATAPSTDGSTLASAGLRQVLFDDSDPRWDTELEQCLSKKLEDYMKNRPPPDPNSPDFGKKPTEVLVPGLGDCRAAHDRRYASGTAGSSAALAVAFTSRFADQEIANFQAGSFLAWATLALSLGGSAQAAAPFQLIATGRYEYDIANNRQNGLAGLRLRWATEGMNLAGDASWTPTYEGTTWTAGAFTAGIHFEIRVAKTSWITATPAVLILPGSAAQWSGTIGLKFGSETVSLLNLAKK